MKLTKFVRLDMKTINPYFNIKQAVFSYVMLLLFSFFIEFIVKTHIPFLSFLVFGMVTLMVGSFPFALEEKNDTNTFYITEQITRKTVVYGRFLYGLFISLVCVISSAVIDICVLFVSGKTDGILLEIIVAAAVFLVLQIFNAFRFPFFFKLGYAKGSVVASIVPMAIIMVGALLIAFIKPDITAIPKFSTETILIVIAAAITLTVVSIVISMGLSVKFYQKREF
jgi:hypothetical protein